MLTAPVGRTFVFLCTRAAAIKPDTPTRAALEIARGTHNSEDVDRIQAEIAALENEESAQEPTVANTRDRARRNVLILCFLLSSLPRWLRSGWLTLSILNCDIRLLRSV